MATRKYKPFKKKIEKEEIIESSHDDISSEMISDTKEEISHESDIKEDMVENIDSINNKKEITKKNVPFILFSMISLSILLILSELVFKILEFGFTFDLSLLRITLFCIGFSGIVATILSLLPLKPAKIIHNILCIVLPIYALFQIGIYNMMHSYATLKTAGGLAGAMVSYVLQYIRQMPIAYWLMLLIPIGYFILQKRYINVYKSKNWKNTIIILASALVLDEAGLLLTAIYGDWEQYSYPTYQESAIREYGIERFLLRDLATIFTEKEATLEEETYEQIDSTREIDDTEWEKLSEEDDNTDRQTIDNYLMNRNIDGYNDKTGLLEGKNLIYIMIEAFDYIGIDEELTPTLYKMMNSGWNFSNHYTPKFDTGTSDSELISETSLIPRRDTNVYAEYSTNDWTNSIFYLFNQAGYTTQAYHNWTDEFYPRKTMMESLYCEDYEDWSDIATDDDTIPGWQSDYELFKRTTDKYINEDKFMTMYITSSTHFPYNTTWDELGNKYLDEINKVHPDYPEDVKHYISKAMELDKGLEYLLEALEEAGKADDTAIVFFADHHPLNMDINYLYDYTPEIDSSGLTVDRSVGMNEFRSPLVMYCPSILGDETFTGVSSTYDILPTVLNLYNINYDPRLLLGTDYFSDSENIVYFPDGDWATDQGIYYASTGTFEPTDEDTEVSDTYVSNMTTKVNNAFNISLMIYQTDYFHYRKGITTPDSSLKNYTTVTDPDTGEEIKVKETEDTTEQ
jgi:lipoteichoic acid synthase